MIDSFKEFTVSALSSTKRSKAKKASKIQLSKEKNLSFNIDHEDVLDDEEKELFQVLHQMDNQM
jgi:glycyl-tRNA synthetase beta subunit